MPLAPAMASDGAGADGAATAVSSAVEDDAAASDNADIIVTGKLAKFGATKSETPILETARSVSIETEQDFRDKGFETLDDALGYTAGVTAEPYGFSTRGDFSAVRGLDVPEYRDNLQFLFGFYNNPRPDLYTLEQVEVLKGPASVLYGAGSPGGIINVVTKRPYAGEGGEVRVETGTFDRFQIATDLNSFIPGTDGTGFARLVALYRDSGTQIDEVHDDKLVIAPAVTAEPTPDTRITVLFNYTKQDTDTAHQFYPLTGTILPSADGRKIDTTEYLGEPGFNRYDSRSFAATVIAEHRISEALTFEGIGRFVDASSDYWQSWPSFRGVGVARIDADGNATRDFYLSERRSEQAAFDTRLRAEFETGPVSHEILAGIQYQDVMTDANNAFLQGGLINVFDPVYGIGTPTEAEMRAAQFDFPSNFVEETGYYISDQMTIGRLIVNGGVRFDEVTNRVGRGIAQKDSATSFAAGVLYRLPWGLSPYASYAESFEPVVGIDTDTGEQLKPQEGRQYEAGLKWQPPGTQALVTLAAFDIEQSNLPNPQALVGANSQQEGIAKIRGIEAEANAILSSLTIDWNFTYLDTEDPDGFQLSTIPTYQASLFGIYRVRSGPLAGLRFGGGIRHVGESESTGITSAGRVLTIVTDGYTVGDAVVGYEFGNWDLSVNARNLTNETYFTTCLARGDCYPGERRTMVANLGYRF